MGLVLRRDDDVADVSVKAGSNDGIVEEGVVSMISPRCFIGRTYSIDDDVHGTVKADVPDERSATTATDRSLIANSRSIGRPDHGRIPQQSDADRQPRGGSRGAQHPHPGRGLATVAAASS